MKIVVTGGAGFIGSNILAGLEDSGEVNLVAVDTQNAAIQNISKRKLKDFIEPHELFQFCEKNRKEIRAIIPVSNTPVAI